MKISRKPWMDILRSLIKLTSYSQAHVYFEPDWVVLHEPHFVVKLPYPPKSKLPVGKVNAVNLLRGLSPLAENIVEVDQSSSHLHLKEETVTIKVPFGSDARWEAPEMSPKASANIVVRELPLILKALRSALGGVKSSGISEYLYWEGSRIYAFNGAVLAVAEFATCPVKRILFTRNVADFLIDIVPVAQMCSILCYPDNTVECNFGDLGSIRFAQPDVEFINWKELTPKESEFWTGVPSVFFRLPQIVMSLSDRHHSRVNMQWKDRKLVVSNGEELPLEFRLEENMQFPLERSGYIDMVALSPILSYAEQMGWTNQALIFKSHVFTFYCTLGK